MLEIISSLSFKNNPQSCVESILNFVKSGKNSMEIFCYQLLVEIPNDFVVNEFLIRLLLSPDFCSGVHSRTWFDCSPWFLCFLCDKHPSLFSAYVTYLYKTIQNDLMLFKSCDCFCSGWMAEVSKTREHLELFCQRFTVLFQHSGLMADQEKRLIFEQIFSVSWCTFYNEIHEFIR
eukprot:TRINITY_DN8626_c0_g2_i1.p1 TRINITY_DN8626_c0_g2~~TRINITY_DN8626_c0_g2_i1.p1  ORF type:complete len:176 (-),score=26.45 TRINITY_DN8626_c0_g2_i1:359-886(-)